MMSDEKTKEDRGDADSRFTKGNKVVPACPDNAEREVLIGEVVQVSTEGYVQIEWPNGKIEDRFPDTLHKVITDPYKDLVDGLERLLLYKGDCYDCREYAENIAQSITREERKALLGAVQVGLDGLDG